MSVLNEFPYNLVPSLSIRNTNLAIAFGNRKKKQKRQNKTKNQVIELSVRTPTSLNFVNLHRIFLNWL